MALCAIGAVSRLDRPSATLCNPLRAKFNQSECALAISYPVSYVGAALRPVRGILFVDPCLVSSHTHNSATYSCDIIMDFTMSACYLASHMEDNIDVCEQ